MAVGGALVAPVHHADAATSVPAVSNLRPYVRYDHTLRAQWDVSAAAYAPGAKVIVRYTRGLTAAATPDAGYAATWVQYARVAEARPLLASTTYTFAVWVRDAAGHLSQRRTLSLATLADTTPPRVVSSPSAQPGLRSSTLVPKVDVRWSPSGDADIASYRVLRTSSDWAHATVLEAAWPTTRYADTAVSLRRDVTYSYYVAARDTRGLLGAYTKVGVTTNARRIGGAASSGTAWFLYVTDTAGTQMDVDVDLDAVTWTAVVVPGRYTVCEHVLQDPGEHFQIIPGCWTPTGTVDDRDSEPPAAARDALLVGADDRPTGIDISLHYR